MIVFDRKCNVEGNNEVLYVLNGKACIYMTEVCNI